MYLKLRPWERVEHNMRSTDDALFRARLRFWAPLTVCRAYVHLHPRARDERSRPIPVLDSSGRGAIAIGGSA